MDTTLSLLIYKLVSLGCGVLVCFFGYRLFVLGIFGNAGELDSQFQNNKLVLKKAAPGTFFSLFGACVIGVALWKGFLSEDGRKIVQGNPPPVAIDPKQPQAGPASAEELFNYKKLQGLGDQGRDRTAEQLESARSGTRATILELNGLWRQLPATVPNERLVDLRNAIRDSKLALISLVWSVDWGNYNSFKDWIVDGETDPLPNGLKPEAVKMFHQGEEG